MLLCSLKLRISDECFLCSFLGNLTRFATSRIAFSAKGATFAASRRFCATNWSKSRRGWGRIPGMFVTDGIRLPSFWWFQAVGWGCFCLLSVLVVLPYVRRPWELGYQD